MCCYDKNTGTCLNCFRRIDEIVNWANYTDAQRDVIMAQLPDRQNKIYSIK